VSAGLWWAVRSSAMERVAAPELDEIGRGERAEALAPPQEEERRGEQRPKAHLFLNLNGRARRHWLSPWCLSRAKRMVDIVGAGVILLILSPALALIAIAIMLDSPGPVFFRQWRTGLVGRRFRIFKFRTMKRDAEKMKESLRSLNHHGPNSVDFKILDDPRVTRVGRYLRRASLDELPNFLNVCRGEMSLVGPRPTSFGIEVYEDWHLRRLAVPPGITGLWQISGRCEIDFDDRVKLDSKYIQEQSFLLDLKILVLTPFKVLAGRGAC